MKFFVDTADLEEIKALNELGMVDGVTTNPSIIAKAGCDFKTRIKEICDIVEGPVSAEVASTDYETMIKEANVLAEIADNVAVKVPMTEAGLRVCRELSDRGILVNVTLCFSPGQALLAAKAGAAFISPFVGRMDDICNDGVNLIAEILSMYACYPNFDTEVLVASVRSPMHIIETAKMGAEVMTCPPSVIRQLYKHPLTDSGLAAFVDDWKKTGQSIL